MRLPQMDLNLFQVFDAIYGKRNLTRAAEILCITQPAVSNALARMRRALNDPLFISTPQGMVPTPLADNIAGHVGEALQLLNAAFSQGETFVPATSRKIFRVSMPDLAESLLLPVLGEALQHEAPGIRIESYYTGRSDIPLELANGNVHLAIDAPLIDDPQVRQTPLPSDRHACMLRPEHPFAGDSLTLEDYLALDHIHISSRRHGLGHVDTALRKLGRRRSIRMRVQHYLVAPLIALRTDLALTAPLRLLQGYDARRFELPFELPPLEWHCYWHRSMDHDQANIWLRDKFTVAIAALQGESPHFR